jgi:DNA polymerase (family 10)
MDQRSAARVLEQIAAFLELKGDNPFRVRAFTTAARTLAAFPGDLGPALADGSLATTRGIGPATLQIVSELVTSGRSSILEELREQVPPGLVEMLQISGLGVAKIRQIHQQLGIESLPELEEAARDGSLAKLPRFGTKTAQNILKSIAFLRRGTDAKLSHHAAAEAAALQAGLERLPGVERAIVAGDIRRRTELAKQPVLAVVAEVQPAELFKRLAQLPGVQEFAGQDERQVTLRFVGGDSARIVVTTPVNAGAVLIQATGSDAHLAELASRATATGFSLTGAALWRGSEFVATPDEASFYRALGLSEIPPELREGRGEVEAASRHALPALLELRDLQGLLHCHTNYSDGSNTIEQLAEACRAAGYGYVGITDHSQSAAYAGGLSPEDLLRQVDEIDATNARMTGFRILKGIEADILGNGALDYDDTTLGRLDFVIGSIHTRFSMNESEMTARILAAMDNPNLTIVGHPTGRLLLSRDPYPLSLDKVFAKAAETGVALEINADPHRLDLDWRRLREARDAGVAISIGADAHNLAGLKHVEYGVAMARKGWLTRTDILNARPVEEFLTHASRRRAS